MTNVDYQNLWDQARQKRVPFWKKIAGMSLPVRILSFIDEYPHGCWVKPYDIADKLGESGPAVAQAIRRLIESKRLTRVTVKDKYGRPQEALLIVVDPAWLNGASEPAQTEEAPEVPVTPAPAQTKTEKPSPSASMLAHLTERISLIGHEWLTSDFEGLSLGCIPLGNRAKVLAKTVMGNEKIMSVLSQLGAEDFDQYLADCMVTLSKCSTLRADADKDKKSKASIFLQNDGAGIEVPFTSAADVAAATAAYAKCSGKQIGHTIALWRDNSSRTVRSSSLHVCTDCNAITNWMDGSGGQVHYTEHERGSVIGGYDRDYLLSIKSSGNTNIANTPFA